MRFSLALLSVLAVILLTVTSCGDSFDVCLNESRTPSFTVNGGTKIWKCFDIEWATEETVIDYQIQIARENLFEDSDIVIDELVDENGYRFVGERGTFFARVRSITGDCGSEWSESIQFYFDIFESTPCVSAEGVAIPTQVAPENGGTAVTGTVKLDWTFVDGGAYYHVQIGPSQDFSDITDSETLLLDTNYDAVLEEAGFYYWRVRAYDELDDHTEWSEVWSLIVEEE